LGDEVAVEEVREVGSNVAGTASLRSAPWVVGATLEFWEEAWLGGRHLDEMIVVVNDLVSYVFSVGTSAFVEVARPARWVAVQSGNIDVAYSTGRKVLTPALGVHIRVVVNERNIDTMGSCRVLQCLHVSSGSIVRDLLFCVLPLLAVLVLDLVDKCIATFGYKMFGGELRELGEVRIQGLEVSWVVVSELSVRSSCEPQREASGIGFSVNVGAGPGNNVQADAFRDLKELGKVMGAALKVECLVVCTVVSPVAIESESREAWSLLTSTDGEWRMGKLTRCLDLLQQIFPNLVDRNAPVVNLSREHEKTLSVDLEGVMVPLYDVVQTIVV
jgi:hypothetical protein